MDYGEMHDKMARPIEALFPESVVISAITKAKAEVLRELAKELAMLQYVRPGEPGREEYEAMLAIRRGNTDVWLKKRADEIEGKTA